MFGLLEVMMTFTVKPNETVLSFSPQLLSASRLKCKCTYSDFHNNFYLPEMILKMLKYKTDEVKAVE